jgi:hypothetical protein
MSGPPGRVASAAAALAVACAGGCSFLDPSIGPLAGDAAPAIDAPSLLDAGGGDAGADAADAATDALRPVSFRNDIRPLMNRSNQDPSGHGCKACHYSTQSAHPCLDAVGLDLSTLGTLRRGGNNTGPAIVIAGDPANSKIVQKLRGTFPRGVRMPRDGPPYWSEAQIALVERWIAEGAIGADDE